MIRVTNYFYIVIIILLPLCYLQTFGHCMSVLRFTASDYTFVIFTRLAIVLSIRRFTASDYPFVIVTRLVIVLSILLFTASDYPFVTFTRLAIVLSILRFTSSDTPLVSSNIWPLYVCPSIYGF